MPCIIRTQPVQAFCLLRATTRTTLPLSMATPPTPDNNSSSSSPPTTCSSSRTGHYARTGCRPRATSRKLQQARLRRASSTSGVRLRTTSSPTMGKSTSCTTAVASVRHSAHRPWSMPMAICTMALRVRDSLATKAEGQRSSNSRSRRKQPDVRQLRTLPLIGNKRGQLLSFDGSVVVQQPPPP